MFPLLRLFRIIVVSLRYGLDELVLSSLNHPLATGLLRVMRLGTRPRSPRGQRLRVTQHAIQRAPVDQLHGVERPAVEPAGFVHRHDRGVLQAGGDQRLALEARGQVGVPRQELLDRDRSSQPAIARRVDAPHAAARDLAADRVEHRIDGEQLGVIGGWRRPLQRRGDRLWRRVAGRER